MSQEPAPKDQVGTASPGPIGPTAERHQPPTTPYLGLPRNSPFTTFPLAFRGSSVTNSTVLGTL